MIFDFIGAIKRPFTSFNKLSIGVILLIIPFVNIITGFLVKGYKLESARTASKKKFTLPRWESFGKLFIRGLLSWIIGILYMIPAIILILISVGKVLYNIFAQYGINQGLSLQNTVSDQLIQNSLLQSTSLIPVFIIGVLLALLGAYLTPIAIMRYVQDYKFGEAFKFNIVFRKAFTGKYFLAILAVIVYAIIIGLINSALALGFSAIGIAFLSTILILIVGGIASFIVMITSYTIFGEVYPKLK